MSERHRHRYEVNNGYRDRLEAAGLGHLRHLAGRPAGRVRRTAPRGAPVLRRHAGAPGAEVASDPGAPAVPRPDRRRARLQRRRAAAGPDPRRRRAAGDARDGRRAPSRDGVRSVSDTTDDRRRSRSSTRRRCSSGRIISRARGRRADAATVAGQARDRRRTSARWSIVALDDDGPDRARQPVPPRRARAAGRAAGRPARRRRRAAASMPRAASWPRRPAVGRRPGTCCSTCTPHPGSRDEAVRVYLARDLEPTPRPDGFVVEHEEVEHDGQPGAAGRRGRSARSRGDDHQRRRGRRRPGRRRARAPHDWHGLRAGRRALAGTPADDGGATARSRSRSSRRAWCGPISTTSPSSAARPPTRWRPTGATWTATSTSSTAAGVTLDRGRRRRAGQRRSSPTCAPATRTIRRCRRPRPRGRSSRCAGCTASRSSTAWSRSTWPTRSGRRRAPRRLPKAIARRRRRAAARGGRLPGHRAGRARPRAARAALRHRRADLRGGRARRRRSRPRPSAPCCCTARAASSGGCRSGSYAARAVEAYLVQARPGAGHRGPRDAGAVPQLARRPAVAAVGLGGAAHRGRAGRACAGPGSRRTRCGTRSRRT